MSSRPAFPYNSVHDNWPIISALFNSPLWIMLRCLLISFTCLKFSFEENASPFARNLLAKSLKDGWTPSISAILGAEVGSLPFATLQKPWPLVLSMYPPFYVQ